MKIAQALGFIAVAAIVGLKGATSNVPAVDTRDHSQLDLLLQMAATDVGLTALKVQESDNPNTGFTDVDGGAFTALPTANDSNKLFRVSVDLLGRKRYIKLVATAPAGTAGANFSVLAILTEGRTTPSNATTRGLAGEIFV